MCQGRVQSLAFADSAHTLCQRTRAKSLFSDSVYALCQGRVQRRFFLTVCMLNLRIHCATGRMQSRVSANSAHTLSAHRATDACSPTEKPCAHGTPGRLEDAKGPVVLGIPLSNKGFEIKSRCCKSWKCFMPTTQPKGQIQKVIRRAKTRKM